MAMMLFFWIPIIMVIYYFINNMEKEKIISA